jgi:VWFA-related protein
VPRRAFAVFISGVLFSAGLLTGQGATGAQSPPEAVASLRTKSSLVLVPTLVRTTEGRPVYTLSAADFILRDDGVPQTVHLDEDAFRQPLALALVLQTGGGDHLAAMRKLGEMLGSITGAVPSRTAVIAFDSTPHLELPFTARIDDAAGALSSLQNGDNGAAILDALALAVDQLGKQPPAYRRAILLVSETFDRGSKIALEDSLRRIGEADAVIYSVAFSTTRAEMKREAGSALQSSTPGPPGGCMSHEPGEEPKHGMQRAEQAWDCLSLLAPPLVAVKMAAQAAQNALRANVPESVARMSGGEYFRFHDAAGMERDLSALSNHIPNRYLLSFQPQSPHPGPHRIEVALPDYPHLRINARDLYWVEDGEKESRP